MAKMGSGEVRRGLGFLVFQVRRPRLLLRVKLCRHRPRTSGTHNWICTSRCEGNGYFLYRRNNAGSNPAADSFGVV
ncbi:hypothetical protein SAMN05421833_1374 [Microbispora rosea]|uniref:Uncharacterized protein n=1 Tax=Microbispora rosea TaxID=58117 RepID=A0A1N7H4S6_9ACTN|nr:hypothetical protein Mro03_68810 [Microbispora rosea subsp. rosea]SIS19813.1 hypothetical protein SAMN05421833_1374 [Microbispora rosea]